MACCFIMLIEYLWFTLLYTIWYFYAFSLCIYTYIHIYIYHICMFFLRGVALGFGLRELHWLGRCSTTEPNSQPYFFLLVVFACRVLHLCLEWPAWLAILLHRLQSSNCDDRHAPVCSVFFTGGDEVSWTLCLCCPPTIIPLVSRVARIIGVSHCT
jgi:hypothetical protein